MLSRCSMGPSPSMAPRNRWATEISASLGHSWNQSMAVQLISPGNLRARVRRVSPTGLMASTTCRFARTRSMKNSIMLSRASGTPAALATLRSEVNIASNSSGANRSGMTPVDRMSFTHTRKRSSSTWASVSRKVRGRAGLTPARWYSAFSSALSSASPKPAVTCSCTTLAPHKKEASLLRLCLPLPPTPMSSALPRGKARMRAMRVMCRMASSKSTSSMIGLVSLYSASLSSSAARRRSMSVVAR
mmetsp:Transcript_31700/g.46427  ORF Transcript_31700/g.46427 Transcript_31700/m.46427 type:complete len:246 (-) Transcript_31700:88-825(-)